MVRYFERFLVRTQPILCETERSLVIFFDLYKPHRTVSVGISLAANRAWSHLDCVSVYRIDLMDLVQRHKLRFLESSHRSCKQSAFLVRIGRISEHVALCY